MPHTFPLQDSPVTALAMGKLHETLLDELIINAMEQRFEPAFERALLQHSPYFQKIVRHLVKPHWTVAGKLARLPRACMTLPSMFDGAINSVLAFAVLLRFDDDFQEELRRHGHERPYVNATNIDLMRAIEDAWFQYGSPKVVNVVAREASHFLVFVESLSELPAAVKSRLIEFRSLFPATIGAEMS